jgi:hypothetical protein
VMTRMGSSESVLASMDDASSMPLAQPCSKVSSVRVQGPSPRLRIMSFAYYMMTRGQHPA